ncbi:hypothetical protein MIMGU_mgv1a018386mg, partial [Erythranthe guttata]
MEEEDFASESASATVRGMEKGSHLFVVKNYSLHEGIGVGGAIESEEFIVGGYGWTIRFILNQTTIAVGCLYSAHFMDQSGKGNDKGLSFFDNSKIMYFERDRVIGRNFFIRRSSLNCPDYLKDDCLKIRVTIEVFTCRIHNLPLIKVPESNIGADFGKLLRSKQRADVFFRVKNKSFCAHKRILAARCPQFLSQVSDSNYEIEVTYMEPNIFKALLWFLYTGTLSDEEHDDSDIGHSMLESFIGKMLAAADRFELKRLKNICELSISKRISGDSIAYILHLAERCHAKELKDACLGFGADNGADVMSCEGRRYLKERCPLLFLELAYNIR